MFHPIRTTLLLIIFVGGGILLYLELGRFS